LQPEHSRSVFGAKELLRVDAYAVYSQYEAHVATPEGSTLGVWNSAGFAEVACVQLL